MLFSCAIPLSLLSWRLFHTPTRRAAGGCIAMMYFYLFFHSGKDPYAAVKKQTAEATQDAINAGINLVRLLSGLGLLGYSGRRGRWEIVASWDRGTYS